MTASMGGDGQEPVQSPGPDVLWLLGQEGGLGLLDVGPDQLILLTGQPGHPDSRSFILGPAAAETFANSLSRWRSTGRLGGLPIPGVRWDGDALTL